MDAVAKGSIIALFIGQFVTTTNLDPLTAILFGQLARKVGDPGGARGQLGGNSLHIVAPCRWPACKWVRVRTEL